MDSIFQFIMGAIRGFNSLSPGRRIALLLVAVMAIGSIVIFSCLMNQVEYRVLFSDLSRDDADKIVLRLQEMKVPYKLSLSGETISVPADQIAELRIALASSGLPHGGGVGFEIFDKKNFGATEFVQNLNYQRALQGELARTICSIDEVKSSRVHIVMPRKSLFVKEEEKPSASVVVKLRPGRRLQLSQVDGIVNLVASSVEGLSPEHVMVVNNSGKILSRPEPSSDVSKLTSSQIEFQRNIERSLVNRIQSMLEKIVGQDKVIARVDTELDFQVTEKTEERYGAEEPAVRSRHRKTEKATTPFQGGESSVSRTRGSKVVDNKTLREKTDEVLNYELNRIVSKTVMPVGGIEKMSVAVLVDGSYIQSDKGVDEYQPRTKKEMAVLEDLVKKTVGFDVERGDQVVVTNVAFRRLDMEEGAMIEASWSDKILPFVPIMKSAALLLALFIVIMLVFRPLLKFLFSRGTNEGNRVAQMLSATENQLEGTVPKLSLEGPKQQESSEMSAIKDMASQDTRTFSELLRNWLE